MASIAYYEKRIAGKQKELDKLTKKMKRIKAAEATGWKKNPYMYDEHDIVCTERDIASVSWELEQYKERLQQEATKEASRKVPAILDFLNRWKGRCMEYYQEAFEDYIVDREAWLKADGEYTDWWNSGGWSDPDRWEKDKLRKEARKSFEEKWRFIIPYVTRGGGKPELDTGKLTHTLDEEAKRKYDFIVERTTAITGRITDASGLYVGDKGELNGYIQGDDGVARIETIGAGGWNIQCFHFRTLVHRM